VYTVYHDRGVLSVKVRDYQYITECILKIMSIDLFQDVKFYYSLLAENAKFQFKSVLVCTVI